MKNLIAIIVILVILVAIGIFWKNRNSSAEENKITTKEPNIQYVSMNDIEKIMNENENYIILDARTIEEYNDGHIPGAICIPNETIDENVVSKLPDKEQLILIYCRSGNRSKQATKKLKDLGYLNLIEFGGIIDWPGEIEK